MEDYKFNEGYLYKDSFSEQDFLNAVLKYIKDDSYAPSYIFDEMTRSNVSRINIPLIQSTGTAEIEYSRMIGYDKLETTTKYKTTTYGNGYQNKTQSTSVRTITDWVNDSGTISGTASSGTYDEKYKIYDEYVANHKMDRNNVRLLSNDELKNCSLTPDMVEFLKNDIVNKVFRENITYPGNHVKNEEYYGTTTLNNISCTIVSLYALTISIRDKNLLFVASSNGEIEIKLFGEYPADNYDEVLSFNRKVTAERKEATKKPRTIAKYTIISTILLFILFLVLGIVFGILALTIISIAILIIGFIIGIKFMIDVKNISKPYYKQIYEHNKKDYENKRRSIEESYQKYINNMKL
ncbi:MAG: hypothetical protein IKP77_05280 [Acholeplasmatales bacterium]|nr:hypothetical protein [Acholeplasmatales bacterium]